MTRFACLSVLLPILLSCNEATGPAEAADLDLSEVGTLILSAGASDTLDAIVRDASGREIPNVPVTWLSSNPTVVRVANGILTADSSGSARITATSGTLSAWVDVTVVQSLAALRIEPADTTIRVRHVLNLRVVAMDGAGREMPLPGTPEFASTDSVIVTVNNSGRVVATGWGEAELHVELGTISASTTIRTEPIELDMNGVQLVNIAVGSLLNGHACGLDAAGVAYCWGPSPDGETGYVSNDSLPVQAVPTSLRFVDIDAGQEMTCGLTAAGEIWCWGDNRYAALGQGVRVLSNGQIRSSEPLLVTGGHQWKALGVGKHMAVCAIDSNDVVYCWGHNDLFQVGRPPRASFDSAVAPIAGSYTAKQVEVGAFSGCALSTDGEPFCWGMLAYPDSLPRPILGTSPPLTFLASADDTACGLDAQGAAYCWGFTESDSLALGRQVTADFADIGPVVGGLQFTELVVTNDGRACGLAKSGRIHCWGNDFSWPGFPNTPPPEFGGSEQTFVDLDAYHEICALTSTGRVFCW